MTIDETEPTLAAIQAASESVRAACHAGYEAPSAPEALCVRSAAFVELL